MDEQEPGESAYASSSNDSDLDRPKGLDFDTGFRHILAPAIFGMDRWHIFPTIHHTRV